MTRPDIRHPLLRPAVRLSGALRSRLDRLAWMRARTWRHHAQRVLNVISVATSQRRQAEQQLRQSAQRLKAVEDSILDQMAVLDQQGVIVAVNAAWRRFGIEQAAAGGPTEQVGTNYLDVCMRSASDRADGALAAHEGIRQVLAGQRPSFTMEYSCEMVDGSTRWFHMTATPLHADGGGAVVIHADITDHKLAQADLHRVQERYRMIVEQSPDAILVAEAGLIMLVNHACVALFGARHADAMLGHPIIEFLALPRDADATRVLRSPDPCEPPLRWQGRLRRLDGSEREVDISAATVPDHGGSAVQMVLRDVSELKRTARLLKSSREELRRLSGNLIQVREEERRRIARELHDELGQQLSALKLDINVLNQSSLSQPQHERLSEMNTRLKELVQSVRRIAADLRPAMLDDLGLEAAVDWLAQDCAAQSGLDVKVHCDQANGEISDAIATAAYRIVQEALTNVRRHAQARCVHIDLAHETGQLVVTISDDGIGMGPADSRKSNSYGLVGMRERARHLGGTLTLKSAPGDGSTLVFRVPLRDGPGCTHETHLPGEP